MPMVTPENREHYAMTHEAVDFSTCTTQACNFLVLYTRLHCGILDFTVVY